MKKSKSVFYVLFLCFAANAVFAADNTDSAEKIRLLAAFSEFGRNGVKQDYAQAFSLYCKAALQGDIESAYYLGFMYFNGRGIPRDLALAMRWFKQAADGGDIQSKNIMTKFYDILPIEDPTCKPALPSFKSISETNPVRKKVAGWVNQIAPNYGIDPRLVMAVIQAESAFNPEAISPKNAQGLMQLIPETAERFGVKDSFNPIQNITGGTAYLHWLLRHFGGKVDLVLAAYNAGEGAVERYQGIPPFEETRNYVKQIQTWYPEESHPVPPETIGSKDMFGKS